MEEEHNFIKTEENYEPAIEKSSSNGIMLTIIFLVLLIAGICYWMLYRVGFVLLVVFFFFCLFFNFMRLMFSLVTVSLSIKIISGTYSKTSEL